MKFHVIFLAVMCAAATAFGQDSGAKAGRVGTPAVERTAPAGEVSQTADDTMRIPSSGVPASGSSGESGTNLWKLVKSGGWAMIPLGFLSVLTVMLVLVYLFTLRRSAILTPHYMNTADVLLKKRDYLGLLAISSRHSEAVARVVQRTLDFATKNPNASYRDDSRYR